MAFSKKKKRRIEIEGKTYYWSATGNDGWISLCIMTEVEGSSRLNCQFAYHHSLMESDSHLVNQFIITPYTVRQTILYALEIGWKPFEKGKDFNLHHIDDKIDLRLDKNRAINEKKSWLKFSLSAANKKDTE